MPYIITAKARNGAERAVYFAPNTLDACAGAMAAFTCGDRRNALYSLRALRSYTASNQAGEMLTARYVAGSRYEAIRNAQRSGAWPAPRTIKKETP